MCFCVTGSDFCFSFQRDTSLLWQGDAYLPIMFAPFQYRFFAFSLCCTIFSELYLVFQIVIIIGILVSPIYRCLIFQIF